MPRKRTPRRGDLVEVSWVDITADPSGDPAHPIPVYRVTYGLYWGGVEIDGLEYLVTTDTYDADNSRQSGYTIYPLGVVRSVDVIKRK
jgi:hypothetical protein